MGFFDHLQPTGVSAIKPQSSTVRTVVVKSTKAPVVSAHLQPAGRTTSPARKYHRLSSEAVSERASSSKSQSPAPSSVKGLARRRRLTPVVQPLTSSSEDTGDEASDDLPRKRVKTVNGSAGPRLNRRLRLENASADEQEDFALVHAADIARSDDLHRYMPAFDGSPVDLQVLLQYPGTSQRER